MLGEAAAAPWAAALGGAINELHPSIREYARGVPLGRVGKGEGIFDRVGTPRRWLWPVLAALARQAVVVPVWRRDVPFRIVNRADASGALLAERTFALPGGPWTMHDAVRMDGRALVDDLGATGRYRASLRAWAHDHALRLRSTGVAVRLGPVRVPVPRLLAPVVQLREGWDDAAGRQLVHLRLEHPLLGVLYEYRGSFTYRIEEEPT